MILRQQKTNRQYRSGTALVQMAVVASIFVLLLFGVIEYGRFIFFRSVLINASREGARYAVVNLDDTTVVTDTQNQVKKLVFGLDKVLANYTCNVYLSDSAGTNLGNAGNAMFGQYVAVEVSADYSPIMPVLLKTQKTITIKSRSLMCSEAN